MLHLEKIQETRTAFSDKRRLAILNFGELAKVWRFPNYDFALIGERGRARLVDVVLGQLSVFLNSFGVSMRDLLNFGRGPSQNPQKLTLAALKFWRGECEKSPVLAWFGPFSTGVLQEHSS